MMSASCSEHQDRFDHEHSGEREQASRIAARRVEHGPHERRADEPSDSAYGVDQRDSDRGRARSQEFRGERPEYPGPRAEADLRDRKTEYEHPGFPLKQQRDDEA